MISGEHNPHPSSLPVPPLNGLVLAGGKSLRMGEDKSTLPWHGKEQRYWLAELLGAWCAEVFISCRPEQVAGITGHAVLPDSFTGIGPYGAILSAFREKPDNAWLVLACDLPLMNAATLKQLVNSRNPSLVATSYQSPFNGFPEPLIAIWEPKAYPLLLSFLSQGYSCPGKVLRQCEVEMIVPAAPTAMMNVNTPSDLQQAEKILSRKIPRAI